MPCEFFVNVQNANEMRRKIDGLRPVPGTCIFIDMCGSTELKRRALPEWIVMIYNTLADALSISPDIRQNVVKLIGDEIMAYISDESIEPNVHCKVFSDLKTILSEYNNELDDASLRLKAAIHHCHDVYNISFHQGFNDYYGNGIDLTARLMKKSRRKSIVVSDAFYQLAQPQYPDFFAGIGGIESDTFNGFVNRTNYRIFQVP